MISRFDFAACMLQMVFIGAGIGRGLIDSGYFFLNGLFTGPISLIILIYQIIRWRRSGCSKDHFQIMLISAVWVLAEALYVGYFFWAMSNSTHWI